MISLIQHFEADFLWKVSLKILNSGILKLSLMHIAVSRVHCMISQPQNPEFRNNPENFHVSNRCIQWSIMA